MVRRTALTALAAAVAVLGGCTSPSPFEEWTDQDLGGRQPRGDWRADPAAADQEPVDQEVTLPDNAAPDDYVRLALARNPAIEQARQRVAARLERIPQATSLEDPMLSVSPFGEMAETAAGQVGVMTRLSQQLPFPGKLKTRGRIALEEAKVAQAELRETRLTVMADTRRAYWNYYYAHRAIDVTEQSRGLLEQFKEAAETAYAVGTATQQDVLRASVELSELTNELVTLRQRRETAIARLNALIDRKPVDASLPPPQPAELKAIELTLDQLIDLATQTNPELERLRHEIAGARQSVDLAGLRRWPDLNVGLSYNFVEDAGLVASPTGDDQWWLTFGLNLPIWLEKYEAAENEARHERLAALAELHQAHNHHSAHLQELLVQVETQQRLVVLFRDVLIPQTRQALEASLSAYRAGDLEFLNVVDNWRNLLRYQQFYHKSLAELEKEFAGIEAVVGQEVPRTPQSPRQPAEPEAPDESEFDFPQNNDAPVEAPMEQQQ